MVILLMGVSGSGKTTVGRALAERLGVPFLDGDDFHPPENVRKMAAGKPLTDDDRRPWLLELRRRIDRLRSEGRSAVLACSALKAAYRDVLMDGAPGVRLVYLRGSYELIAGRLARRRGHFMPPGLLRSQFEALEEPDDALVVDVARSPDEIAGMVVEKLGGLWIRRRSQH